MLALGQTFFQLENKLPSLTSMFHIPLGYTLIPTTGEGQGALSSSPAAFTGGFSSRRLTPSPSQLSRRHQGQENQVRRMSGTLKR